MVDAPVLACEVLIVGAGPTGLMAATLLKRSGIDVRIVEKRAEASRESRAFAIQARSLELFLKLGLADRLLDKGVINTAVDVFVGGHRVGGLNFDLAGSPDTPFPFMFLLPQSETEAVLIDDLGRQGVAVERQVDVTGLEQDAGGVTVHTGGSTIRAAYVIGADGAHSVVRKALGIPFAGAQYAQTFLLADCRVRWPLDHARFRMFMRGSSIALFLPLAGSTRSRVMATDHSGKADDDGAEAAALDLSEIQAAFAEAAGFEVELSDPIWTTRYRVHHRGVDRYAEGRTFLAGDAAHIHSPAGGQGMNTGLQDAANLAWKIAAVLRGAEPDLLATYDAERRPVGARVVKTTDKLFSAATGLSGWEASLRDLLARPASVALSNLRPAQHKAFRAISELDIAYGPSRFVEEGAARPRGGGPRVGERALNAAIARHRDVFDLLSGYGFTVLALSRRALDPDETARILAELGAVGAGSRGVASHLVSRVAAGRGPDVVVAESAEVFDAYGLKDADAQAIYLVRPDGYVAWRNGGLDVAGARLVLARFGIEP